MVTLYLVDDTRVLNSLCPHSPKCGDISFWEGPSYRVVSMKGDSKGDGNFVLQKKMSLFEVLFCLSGVRGRHPNSPGKGSIKISNSEAWMRNFPSSARSRLWAQAAARQRRKRRKSKQSPGDIKANDTVWLSHRPTKADTVHLVSPGWSYRGL